MLGKIKKTLPHTHKHVEALFNTCVWQAGDLSYITIISS